METPISECLPIARIYRSIGIIDLTYWESSGSLGLRRSGFSREAQCPVRADACVEDKDRRHLMRRLAPMLVTAVIGSALLATFALAKPGISK